MMARNTKANVSVIALVGERGREVREFIEATSGEGLKRSVVIVATSEVGAICACAAPSSPRPSRNTSATVA